MIPARPLSLSWLASFALVLGLGGLCLSPSRTDAIILLDTADISANTTAPGGPLAGSGWQFQGSFGLFLGTPIAPQFFATATHTSFAAGAINFLGQDYTVIKRFNHPGSDLTICQVTGTFPSFAPIYSGNDETGRALVVIGRGTRRGGELFIGPDHKGWTWGSPDGVMRWGQNTVASIESGGASLGDFLYATFDQGGMPSEAHFSSGDSGGAAFIQDGATWKLAGINYAVDEVFVDNGMGSYTSLTACIFDARGFYYWNGTAYALIAGTEPEPTGFYATRLSTKLAWIYSVTDPTGSVSGDGVPNLLKYALGMDPLQPTSGGTSQPGREPGYATITYNRQTTATDLAFSIERSTDVAVWTTAGTSNEIVQTNGTVQTIKAKVALNNEPQLFLRLRVTRP